MKTEFTKRRLVPIKLINVVLLIALCLALALPSCQSGRKTQKQHDDHFLKPGKNEMHPIMGEPLSPEDVEDHVFILVEEAPEFRGGEAARLRFLAENIRYPQLARERGIQGTVFVSFFIETDGSLKDIQILQGIGGGCDEEVIRVIKKMPAWIPAKQKGKPVRVKYTMLVNFTLGD